MGLQLPLGDRVTLLNAQPTTCPVAGDMNSLTDVQDADYTPVWSKNRKTAMWLEQGLVDKWELQDAWPLTRSSDELREGNEFFRGLECLQLKTRQIVPFLIDMKILYALLKMSYGASYALWHVDQFLLGPINVWSMAPIQVLCGNDLQSIYTNC